MLYQLNYVRVSIAALTLDNMIQQLPLRSEPTKEGDVLCSLLVSFDRQLSDRDGDATAHECYEIEYS